MVFLSEYEVHFRLPNDEAKEEFEEFKKAVMRRHGKLRGSLGEEFYRLLKESGYTPESENKKEKKFQSRTRKDLLRIFKDLPDEGKFPEQVLDRILERNGKTSKPTINRYKNIMIGHGMLIPNNHLGSKKFSKGDLPDWLRDSNE